jgi:hypothetical protein
MNKSSSLSRYIESIILNGTDPSRRFSQALYKEINEDIKSSGVPSILHYLEFGIKEERMYAKSESNFQETLHACRCKSIDLTAYSKFLIIDIQNYYEISAVQSNIKLMLDCLEFKNYHKKYYIDNKDIISLKMKDNYLSNIEERKIKNKKYREDNKDVLNEYHINYRKKNPERIKEYKEKNKEKLKEYNTLYWSKRMKEDELFRFKSIMRKSIGNLIKNKSKSTQDIIGCSFEEFKSYLESKFDNWMNWENKGLYNGYFNYGWDIDHIIPLSTAKTEEEVIKLNHYTNLQPLDSHINRNVKRDKIDFT